MPCAKVWKLAFRNLLKIVWPSTCLLSSPRKRMQSWMRMQGMSCKKWSVPCATKDAYPATKETIQRSIGFCGYTGYTEYTVYIENTSCRHYTSYQEIDGSTTLVNIHCPFSPSAQICSQANWPHDHGPPNVYKHLPNKSPFPKLKEHHWWICSTRSSPGTLLFKKAKKPCVESHGREPTLKSNRDEKMRLKWWICPCCSKK